MGGVTIRANSPFRVMLPHYLLAMRRFFVIIQLIRMACCATSVWYSQAPSLTPGTPPWRYVKRMRVVTIFAGCICLCRIILVLAGMKRFLVRLDILHHHTQPGLFLGLFVLLGGFP